MQTIRVGCAVVAGKGGRLLLGRRGKEPFYGKWVIPGGGIHLFENFTETAKREFSEETGLEIRVERIAHVAEIISPPQEHRIVIYLEAQVVGGNERAGSDLLEIRYFERNQIEQLASAGQLTPTVEGVLRQLGWISGSQMPSAHITPTSGIPAQTVASRQVSSPRRSASGRRPRRDKANQAQLALRL